ncbi:MAG TPA: hypothetical protein PLC19_07800, partial [Marmoricola sp.]|nr:hypothetical protein [Marmoricola sp.]
MSVRVRVSRSVHLPAAEVTEFAMDTSRLFPCFAGVARFEPAGQDGDSELWDIHLRVGSYEVGSRVAVRRTAPAELTWESVRGARNQARLWVEPAGADESLVHVVLKFHLDGGILARAAMLLARG